jgi:hypothetical protein
MKILVSGCSICAGVGFTNIEGNLWSTLVNKAHNIKNVSVGGQSNQTIFNKTCNEILTSEYDLVIIGWTSLFRLNFNYSYSIYENPVNFNISNRTIKIKEQESFCNYWRKYLTHGRIELTVWLTQIITLSRILKERNIPHIFLKFFDNFLIDVQKEHWQDTSEEFQTIVLFRDMLPDWEIEKYFNEIKALYVILEKETDDTWTNLKSKSYYDARVDVNEDGSHPGKESHKMYYNKIADFVAKQIGIKL